MRRWSLALGALALAGGGMAWASMTLTPASHNFGQIVLGTNSPDQQFQLTGTAPQASRGVLKVRIGGPDAADFDVASGWLVPPATAPGQQPPAPPGSCFTASWALRGGSCTYAIRFTPHSVGRKTAQLIVDDPGTGETATATLTGDGIFGCRPYLVACNYAHNYSGTFSVTTDVGVAGGTNRKGHWHSSVVVTVTQGIAWCDARQDDWEEEYNAGKLYKRSTAAGEIHAAGLFAVEFRRSQAQYEYTLSFACPSVPLKTTSLDTESGETGTGSMPSDSVDWRRRALVADPQPATQIGIDLNGKQTDIDPSSAANNGMSETTVIIWALKRW